MSRYSAPTLTRRAFLASAAATVTGAMLPISPALPGTATTREISLRAALGRVRLMPPVETAAWLYNGAVPAPESTSAKAIGCASRSTTPLPKKPRSTGMACEFNTPWMACPTSPEADRAGERFVYEFDAVDAGTFWYHPHQRSFEQVGRGLYGPLIVEEPEPLRVDRDVTWALGELAADQIGRNQRGLRQPARHPPQWAASAVRSPSTAACRALRSEGRAHPPAAHQCRQRPHLQPRLPGTSRSSSRSTVSRDAARAGQRRVVLGQRCAST